MVIASSISGLPIYAPSAAFAPTNSANVSAIASAYQVVSATATQLYAGTAYVTSVNDAPISAARAGNAANASMANSAYYDGTGRLISSLPDSAAVSSIASSYAESAASSKLDSSASSSFYPADNPSGFISSVDLSNYATTAYVDSSVSSKLDSTASSQFLTAVPAGYATTDYVDSSISGFAYNSAVSGWTAKQDQLTYGYNAANQISSIDGSALGGMDDAAVSAIASAYAESAASGKQDTLTFGYDTADKISGINGSALAGEGGMVTAIGTSTSGITSINNSGLVDTAALHSADYSSLYVQEPLYISASGDSSYIGISGNVGGVDSATCSAIASSYAESAVSSYVPYSSLEYNTASAISAINGSAIGAERAVNDENGNNIVTTYATKTDVETALGDIETLLAAI